MNAFDWDTKQPSIFMPITITNIKGKEVRSKSDAQQLRVAQGNGTKGHGRQIKISPGKQR